MGGGQSPRWLRHLGRESVEEEVSVQVFTCGAEATGGGVLQLAAQQCPVEKLARWSWGTGGEGGVSGPGW